MATHGPCMVTMMVSSPATALIFSFLLSALSISPPVTASADAVAAELPSSPLLAGKRICIAGAGPCGLFLAMLLLRSDPTVRVTVLERSDRCPRADVNGFGIGLGARLARSLEEVPGLRPAVESAAAETNFGLGIVGRADLSERMRRHLEGMDGRGARRRCRVRFGEGCSGVDLDRREVTTTSGNVVPYDLLVGADGIGSTVRAALVKGRGLREEHYLGPGLWKALRLPPQPDFDAGSMKPLRHPLLATGRMLPRHPGGHTVLLFWNQDGGENNPGNVDTVDELKELIADALQDEPPKGAKSRNLKFASANWEDNDFAGKRRDVVFDDEAAALFLRTRPGRSHYMKLDRFQDDSVALVGDAAHGMSTSLGQGCAAGLRNARVLAEELGSKTKDLDEALRSYSKRTVRDSHAITDLNLVSATALGAGPFLRTLIFPIVLIQKILGMTIFQQMSRVDVSYEQVLRQNWFLVPYTRLRWRRERVPFP